MDVVIELNGERVADMHSIHKRNCSHLDVPEDIGNYTSRQAILDELASWGTNFQTDIAENLIKFAPCTKGLTA